MDHNESFRKGIESGKRSEKTRTSRSDSTLAYEQLVTKSLGVKSERAVPLIFSMINIRVYKTLPVGGNSGQLVLVVGQRVQFSPQGGRG